MLVKIQSFTAPAHWACYFINGDCTGMEDGEISAADAWIESVGLGAPADCIGEPEFLSCHDARDFALPCDCLAYTFITPVTTGVTP